MQFNLEVNREQYAIRAYGPGTITVTIPPVGAPQAPSDSVNDGASQGTHLRQEILRRSLIISPSYLLRDWAPQTFDELTSSHMTALLELAPEIVLLGTGAQLRWPVAEIVAPLTFAGIGLEVMNTAAACRTYNILVSDGRRVAAALFIIE